MKYLRRFDTTSEYESYAESAEFVTPNVSLCKDTRKVEYNRYVALETRVVAKFNVTSTSNPTEIGYNQYTSGFSAIEIDGVAQPSVVSAYTFSTTGEHTVKYTLTDPTSISNFAFYNCSGLTSIVIPNGVTSIGYYAFSSCSGLTTCTIGSGVTSIGESAFNGCSNLTSINIPSGVTEIGQYAFIGCKSLTNITIHNSVTSIGKYAFSSCSGLTSATVNATTPPTLGSGAFNNNASGRKIYVPSASVETYKSATNWSTYASDIEPIS